MQQPDKGHLDQILALLESSFDKNSNQKQITENLKKLEGNEDFIKILNFILSKFCCFNLTTNKTEFCMGRQ